MTEKNLAWKDSTSLADIINLQGIRIKIRAQTMPEKSLETKDTEFLPDAINLLEIHKTSWLCVETLSCINVEIVPFFLLVINLIVVGLNLSDLLQPMQGRVFLI